MAILAALALPSFLGLREDSKKAVCEANRTILLREYKAQCVRDNSLTLSAFLKTHERLQNNQTDCPSGGTYSTKDEATILCSKHNSTGEEPPGGGTGGEDSVDLSGNISYEENDIPIWTTTDYGTGKLVRDKNGVVYECINQDYDSNTDPAGPYSYYAWRVVGTTNGKAISMDGNSSKRYLPGTTVSYKGKTYIYSPVNSGAETSQNFNQITADFVEITSENKDSIVKPTKSTVLYKTNTAYKKGDVVWHFNQLYIATEDTSGSNQMPGQNPTYWTVYTS